MNSIPKSLVWAIFLAWLVLGTIFSSQVDDGGGPYAEALSLAFYVSTLPATFFAAYRMTIPESTLLPVAVFVIVGYPLFECDEDCIGAISHALVCVIVVLPAALVGAWLGKHNR